MSTENKVLVGLVPNPDEIKVVENKKVVEIRFGMMRWGFFEKAETQKKSEGFSFEELKNTMERMQCMYGFELIYE